MGYIEKSMGRSEALRYRARFAALSCGCVGPAVGLGGRGALLLYASSSGALSIAVLLSGLAAFLVILVSIWTPEIEVTNQRLIFKRGLLWRSNPELSLRAIEEVRLQQGLFGRLLNFDHLELRGTGVDNMRLPVLADPMGLRRALQDGMAATAQVGATGAPAAPAPAAWTHWQRIPR